MFLKEVFHAHPGCIYFEILLQFQITVFFVNIVKCNVFLWWWSWIFRGLSVFNLLCHFRNHSNMVIWCSRNIYY